VSNARPSIRTGCGDASAATVQINLPAPQMTVLLISGMRDNACREMLARVLERQVGVRQVHVNLYRAAATVVHDASISVEGLIQAIIQSTPFHAHIHMTHC
jgi:cation transport ATPase